MSSSKEIDLQMDFAAGVYLSETQSPIPPLTHSMCIQYTYSHCEGGWRVEPERRLEGQQFTKLGGKYQHDWLYFQSITLMNTSHKAPLQKNFFRLHHFALVSIKLIIPCLGCLVVPNKIFLGGLVMDQNFTNRTTAILIPILILILILIHSQPGSIRIRIRIPVTLRSWTLGKNTA